VNVLGSVFGIRAHLTPILITEFTHGSLEGTQFVRADRIGSPMTLQRLLHESEGSLLVAVPGDVGFQNFALVVHRPPKVVHLAFMFA
jgi:hypothetical protein